MTRTVGGKEAIGKDNGELEVISSGLFERA